MICIANGETTNITNKEQLLGIQKITEIKFVVKFEAIQHIISSSCSAPSDGTSPHEFTYNHFGQLTQVTDDAGVRTISYNAYGERAVDSLLADGVSHVISEQWDEFGRSVGYTYAKDGVTQQVATQSYGREGRIATAGFLHGGALKTFEYNYLPGSNLMESLTMPNNMTLTQSYEPQRDLLTGMEYKRGADLAIYACTYEGINVFGGDI